MFNEEPSNNQLTRPIFQLDHPHNNISPIPTVQLALHHQSQIQPLLNTLGGADTQLLLYTKCKHLINQSKLVKLRFKPEQRWLNLCKNKFFNFF